MLYINIWSEYLSVQFYSTVFAFLR